MSWQLRMLSAVYAATVQGTYESASRFGEGAREDSHSCPIPRVGRLSARVVERRARERMLAVFVSVDGGELGARETRVRASVDGLTSFGHER